MSKFKGIFGPGLHSVYTIKVTVEPVYNSGNLVKQPLNIIIKSIITCIVQLLNLIAVAASYNIIMVCIIIV